MVRKTQDPKRIAQVVAHGNFALRAPTSDGKLRKRALARGLLGLCPEGKTADQTGSPEGKPL
jgi:hypothetical protein